MSEVTTRKRINISTFHAHAGITRSTIEGVADSTTTKTISTEDISQAALQAAVDSYVYSEPAPEPLSDAQKAETDMQAVRAKALAVFNGTDTFSPAQMQKLVAGIVLRLTRG